MTLEEDTSFTVKNGDVEGWIEIALNETDSGFVTKTAEETAETPEEEPADGAVISEEDETASTITLAAGTEIYPLRILNLM
jgi:hypothetical protein